MQLWLGSGSWVARFRQLCWLVFNFDRALGHALRGSRDISKRFISAILKCSKSIVVHLKHKLGFPWIKTEFNCLNIQKLTQPGDGMANNVFNELLVSQIDNFIYEYSNTSKNIFFDQESKKLRHPGEYGRYRENVAKDFLRFVVPRSIDLGNGFIITSRDRVSTQCDLVLFDKSMTPLYRDGEKQVFFPIESVAGVGEIKSTLSRSNLIDALEKLYQIKSLNTDVNRGVIVRKTDKVREELCDLFTFLICKKLDFDLGSIFEVFDSVYQGREPRYKHNMILSIDDGIGLYTGLPGGGLRNEQSAPYSFWDGEEARPRFVSPDTNRYVHYQLFCSYMFMLATSKIIFYPEFTNYINPIEGGRNFDI